MVVYFEHTELKEVLQKFEEIAFAYVFGSSQDEIVNEGSDIGIAVYFIKNENKLELRLHIIAELEKTIPNFSNYDLVILNPANSFLAMEAIKGKLLFVKEEYKDGYAAFYSLTCRQFEDDNYWMKKQLEYRGYEVQCNN